MATNLCCSQCTVVFGACAIGWAFSPHFRCTTMLIVPQALGREGRTFVMVFVIAGIYNGPIANIQHNVEEIGKSVGCTVEMQVNHSKQVWKVMMVPFKDMVQDLVRGGREFEDETKDIEQSFGGINEQLAGEYGYKLQKRDVNVKNVSTQEDYEIKTKMRCEYVIQESVERCKLWFDTKYDECMRTIAVPIINHLLCIPMHFRFLCDIMYVMTDWCKKRIPVDGNFGQTYDKVSDSVNSLSKEFHAEMTVKAEERDSIIGLNISKATISEELKLQMEQKKILLDSAMSVIQVLISCTFIFLFFGAFQYTGNYNRDIHFDNFYITTYFRQIDARRKKLGKRTLLPLKNAEKDDFIIPTSLKIHSQERNTLILALVNFFPVAIFLGFAFLVDHLLYVMLATIRKHSFVQYSFHSSHHLEVIVGGEGMLARLLRRTVGALNSSSSIALETNNLQCLPDPTALTRKDYLITSVPVIVIFLMCFLQVYLFRIRRVLASFYFPKREKKRVLFLYNEYLRKRVSFLEQLRKKIMWRAKLGKTNAQGLMNKLCKLCACLHPYIRRRCFVCESPQNKTSVTCPTQDCGVIYCQLCWKDMQYFCFACTPYQDFVSDISDNEEIARYVD
ncbi:E3 ubiquitin-protein ligase DCST1 [Protopterus annectens]|uniref:E3 ubiquitin-protein ligase DCST1 n=1 Tax=Protopterus annectens TaxID=7888 RepID=UPI001CFB2E10|nr:E3 ubiquitin-protein ligase DCST1 [Protopterus annectens]